MSVLSDGRNEIRVNNSDAKCLMENWVEERAVAETEEPGQKPEFIRSAKELRHGHSGLLETARNQPIEGVSTTMDTYRTPRTLRVQIKGTKQELLEKNMYDEIRRQVFEEFNPPKEIEKYSSVTTSDFNRDFVSKKVPPTEHHDLVREQPVTFWTEHQERLHGISQQKMEDSPFRKNSAFSKPIDEYLDEPKPHDRDNYPRM